jgi:hypothetical protein
MQRENKETVSGQGKRLLENLSKSMHNVKQLAQNNYGISTYPAPNNPKPRLCAIDQHFSPDFCN